MVNKQCQKIHWNGYKNKLWLIGWGLKVCVQNRLKPSSGILHHYHLTSGSTLTSQDYNPSSVVYVPDMIRAIYLAALSNRLFWLRQYVSKLSLFQFFNWGHTNARSTDRSTVEDMADMVVHRFVLNTFFFAKNPFFWRSVIFKMSFILFKSTKKQIFRWFFGIFEDIKGTFQN